MELVADAAQAAAQSKAWAEAETLPDPAVPGSRAARAWAERAKQDGAAQAAISAPSARYSCEQAARATLAATQAAVMQPAYDPPADGLAATEHGAIFGVHNAGDTFVTIYRNDAGVAAAVEAFPSKAFMDGIAPAVKNNGIAPSRARGVDVANPGLDNGAAIRAAFEEAMAQGKTIDLGNDDFRVGAQRSSALPIGSELRLRGEGAKFSAVNGMRTKPFAMLRAPVRIESVRFDNFANLLMCDTDGIDLGENDVIPREIDHLNAGGALISTKRETFRIRNLIIETATVDGPADAGSGTSQGIRYQSNGFARAYLLNIVVRNRSYQGVRIGGYPHDLALNQNIHVESIHVYGVLSFGQSNGIQAFGSDIFMNDLFVRNVDCNTGNSSNVEPVYVVATWTTLAT